MLWLSSSMLASILQIGLVWLQAPLLLQLSCPCREVQLSHPFLSFLTSSPEKGTRKLVGSRRVTGIINYQVVAAQTQDNKMATRKPPCGAST
eukprot:455254-Pelagomonas_calceolata.AAC.1